MPPFLIFPGTFPLDLTLFTTSLFSFPSPSHSLSSRFGTPFTHQWECEGRTFRPRNRTTPKDDDAGLLLPGRTPGSLDSQASTRLAPRPRRRPFRHDQLSPSWKTSRRTRLRLACPSFGKLDKGGRTTRSLSLGCDGFVSYTRRPAPVLHWLFPLRPVHPHSTPSSSVPKPTSSPRPTAQTNRSSFLAPPAACVYQQSGVQTRHIHERTRPSRHPGRPSFSPLLSPLVDSCANISTLFCSSIASFFSATFTA